MRIHGKCDMSRKHAAISIQHRRTENCICTSLNQM